MLGKTLSWWSKVEFIITNVYVVNKISCYLNQHLRLSVISLFIIFRYKKTILRKVVSSAYITPDVTMIKKNTAIRSMSKSAAKDIVWWDICITFITEYFLQTL